MPSPVKAGTFRTIDLRPEGFTNLDIGDFATMLLAKLENLKVERSAYYENLRKDNSSWANGSRQILAFLGSIAFLLTGLVAILRFAPDMNVMRAELEGKDKGILLIVLTIYAIMGTISFYEKGTDKTSAYFRHLAVILAIRDLWTKLQFEFLKAMTALNADPGSKAAEATARERLNALAEAFCNDLNKASTDELGQWRTELMESLSELADVAKKGSEDVTRQFQEMVKTAEKSAADARAAADKASQEAQAAARAAMEAGKPGSINVTLEGDIEGEVAVSVDGVEVVRSHGKTIAVDPVVPGIRKFSAQAQKGPIKREASQMVEVKPGLQDLKLSLA